MEKIAILDHDEHRLYVEDLPDEVLDSPDWGGEEEYILDNYNVDNYSWEYIIDVQYFPEYDKVPIEINFKDMADI